MKISAKIDYASKALLELANARPNPRPMPIQEIADSQEIPLKFLTQILINLKQMGLVKSTRGKSGGYVLAKPPKDIVLSDVIRAFGGLETGRLYQTNSIMEDIWEEVDDKFVTTLKKFNFQQILERQKEKDNMVNYVI